MHTFGIFCIVSTVLCIKVTYPPPPPPKKKSGDKSVVTPIFIQRAGIE